MWPHSAAHFSRMICLPTSVENLSGQAMRTALGQDVILGAVAEGDLIGCIQFGEAEIEGVSHVRGRSTATEIAWSC